MQQFKLLFSVTGWVLRRRSAWIFMHDNDSGRYSMHMDYFPVAQHLPSRLAWFNDLMTPFQPAKGKHFVLSDIRSCGFCSDRKTGAANWHLNKKVSMQLRSLSRRNCATVTMRYSMFRTEMTISIFCTWYYRKPTFHRMLNSKLPRT